MFSGALLGLVALDQGVSIAAAAMLMLYAQDLDGGYNTDWNSLFTLSSYAAGFVYSAAGLSFFFSFALIGCLNRVRISVKPSTFVAAIIMSLQVAVGAAMAVFTCIMTSPFGPHSDYAPTAGKSIFTQTDITTYTC